MFANPSIRMNIPAGHPDLLPLLCLRHTLGFLTAHTHTGVPRKSWSDPTSEINNRDTTSICLQRRTNNPFKTPLRSQKI